MAEESKPGEPEPRDPDGRTVRAWREYLDMSQAELGERCPKALSPSRIQTIEVGASSTTVRELLNVIRGLGIPGKDDAQRLERFFGGPLESTALEDAQAAQSAVERLRDRLAWMPQSRRRSGGPRG